MKRETALTWSWLNLLNKKRYDALQEVFGDLDTALGALDENVLKQLGCRDDTVFKTLNRLEEFDVTTYEAELKRRNISFLAFEDDAFPSLLKAVPDAPVFLYYKGDLSITNRPCIAVVGTRDPSSYGKLVTERFVPDFVRGGLTTVSGLAAGIDAFVARATLDADGKTVAVLGHGMASIHPKENARLASDIIDGGGVLISEFPLDVIAGKYTFPARNRIIAGLSMATVVIEAGEGSGALITADLACEYGRDIFAVPGNVFDDRIAGCHQFIAEGRAQLAVSSSRILSECGVVASESSVQVGYEPQNDQERLLMDSLTTLPQSVSDIARKCAAEAATINATLTLLELYGAAKNTGNGMWVRT